MGACAHCGETRELLYACSDCGRRYCAWHHPRSFHDCDEHSTEDGTVSASVAGAGGAAGDPASGVDRPPDRDMGRRPRRRRGEDPSTLAAPSRPGYGPDEDRPEEVGPPETIAEWFRRQTYLSLTFKVGLMASVISTGVYFGLLVALTLL